MRNGEILLNIKPRIEAVVLGLWLWPEVLKKEANEKREELISAIILDRILKNPVHPVSVLKINRQD